LVLINGKKDLEFEQILTKHNQKIHIFYFKYILNKPAEYLNKKLIAFAGIGNPENFFDLLKLNGLNIVKEISFPDHHKFSNNDLNNLLNLEKTYNAKLVTTEKDYLRINSIERRKFGVIPIKIVIDNEENLAKILRNLINK
jgi:Tetraacyldisaccharide-1-P 4''-kinase